MVATIAEFEAVYEETDALLTQYGDRMTYFREFHDATDFIFNQSDDLPEVTQCIVDDLDKLDNALKILSAVPKVGAIVKPMQVAVSKLEAVATRIQDKVVQAQDKLQEVADSGLDKMDDVVASAEAAIALGLENVDHTLAGFQELRDGLTKTDTDPDAIDLSGNVVATEIAQTLDDVNLRLSDGLTLSEPFFEDFAQGIDAFITAGEGIEDATESLEGIKGFLDEITNPFDALLDALNHYAKVPDLGIDIGDLLGDLGLGDLSL